MSRTARDRSRTPQPPPGEGEAGAHRPDWRWRSFPVFAAFVAGMMLVAILNGAPNNAAAAAAVWIAVLGCSYALAHFVTMRIYVPWRRRRSARSTSNEYEDVVVYKDAN